MSTPSGRRRLNNARIPTTGARLYAAKLGEPPCSGAALMATATKTASATDNPASRRRAPTADGGALSTESSFRRPPIRIYPAERILTARAPTPRQNCPMHETPEDLDRLQSLLDESYAAAGPHLGAIHT